MPTDPNTAAPQKPRRRWFQFRLRSMLIVTAALALLFAQWPWVDRTLVWNLMTAVGVRYFVPARVVLVVSIEGAALIGWLVWTRVRRRAAT